MRRAVDEAERCEPAVDSTLTVAMLADDWLISIEPSVKPRTFDAYSQHVRDHIKPRIGSVRVRAVDRQSLQRFVQQLNDHLSAKTTRCVYSTLSQILASGDRAPVRGVRLPRVERLEVEPPTLAEVEQLVAAIDPRKWALVRLCGYCGLRQGEALALRPVDVDWEQRRIRVSGSLNQRSGIRESTKNGRGRWVTMPSIVTESLQAHVVEYPPSDYLFHRADGRPWKASRVWEAWDLARKRCDLAHVDFHHLRHAAASLMIRAGLSPKRVQVELGHSDPAFTLRVYGHLWPDEIDIGRTQVDALLASIGSQT